MRDMNCSISQLLSLVSCGWCGWEKLQCVVFFLASNGSRGSTTWDLTNGSSPSCKLKRNIWPFYIKKKWQSFHWETHFYHLFVCFLFPPPKELMIILREEEMAKLCITYMVTVCYFLLFADGATHSLVVYIVTRVICCWLWKSHEHSLHILMYCMLNPFDIIWQECSVWLHSLTLLPWKCTVSIWKGQLFILISSFLKWCFNVIYISHWLFKLLNVFYHLFNGTKYWTEYLHRVFNFKSLDSLSSSCFQLLQVKLCLFF